MSGVQKALRVLKAGGLGILTGLAVLGLASTVLANLPPIYGGLVWSSFFTGNGTASSPLDVAPSGVSAGSYTNTNLTVAASGQVTVASNGVAGGAGLFSPVLGTKPTTSTLPSSLNIGSSTVSSNAVGLGIVPPSSSGDNLRVRYTTAPGTTPYSFAAYVCVEGPLNTAGATATGIGWYDGSAKLQTVQLQNTSGGYNLNVNNWTNVTTFSAALFSVASPFYPCGWLGIKNDGTNVYFAWSADGVNYYVVEQQALSSSFLGSGNYVDVFFFIDDTRSSTTSGASLLAWVQNAW